MAKITGNISPVDKTSGNIAPKSTVSGNITYVNSNVRTDK